MAEHSPDKSHADGREGWSEVLEQVSVLAVLPPKQGYERRAIYLCVEDECDAGGEYVEVFDVSMEELNLLRGLLASNLSMGGGALKEGQVQPVPVDSRPAAALPSALSHAQDKLATGGAACQHEAHVGSESVIGAGSGASRPAAAHPSTLSTTPQIKVFAFGADRYEGDQAIHEMCVRASDYQKLLARFEKACGEVTRLSGFAASARGTIIDGELVKDEKRIVPYFPTWQMKEAGGETLLRIVKEFAPEIKGLNAMQLAEGIYMEMLRHIPGLPYPENIRADGGKQT